MSEVIARDDRTIDILWKETYISANALIENDLAPIPKHLLEDLYVNDKAGFANSNFWNGIDFISNGPYRLTKWDRGTSLTVTANPYFALGKPKMETIEYHFVQDANTLVANFLAGIIDFGQYTAITSEMAVTLRDRWKEDNAGRVLADTVFGVRIMEFQHRDVAGHQKIVTDVRGRQALMHAIDRDALAEELQYGFATAAYVSPTKLPGIPEGR
jgi:ABC-type transport system substrate-binding protein